ncbi:LPD23 domain-containing protein, partial [Campylobacter sp.]|uniref:LPD23 domain-containing protein n=2 Tax=Campylobacter sp. TaxID=205 RepID=UPI002A592D84
MKLSSVFSYADIVDMRNEGLNDDEIIQRAKQKVAYQNSPEYQEKLKAGEIENAKRKELAKNFANYAITGQDQANLMSGRNTADEIASKYRKNIQNYEEKQIYKKQAEANANSKQKKIANAIDTMGGGLGEVVTGIAKGATFIPHTIAKALANNTDSQLAKNFYEKSKQARSNLDKAQELYNARTGQEGKALYKTGEIATEILTDPLTYWMPFMKAPTFAARGAGYALTGAAEGALHEYGSNEKASAEDIAKMAGLGAALGLGGGALIEGAIKGGGALYSKFKNRGAGANTEPNSAPNTQNSSTAPNTPNSNADDLATNGIWMEYSANTPQSLRKPNHTSNALRANLEDQQLTLKEQIEKTQESLKNAINKKRLDEAKTLKEKLEKAQKELGEIEKQIGFLDKERDLYPNEMRGSTFNTAEQPINSGDIKGSGFILQGDRKALPSPKLKTADDDDIIDLVPDENGVYQVVYNGSSKELAKIATEIAKGEIQSLGAKRLVFIADNIAETAAKDAEQKISANIAKIDDDSVELYANNTALLADIAKKYPMLNKDEQIELLNKQILANASAELLEYSKFLNGGALPNDARLLGKNAGRMILKSLNAGASPAEVINMLLKAGISGRNSTAAKALIQTGDINAYNAQMRKAEAELIAELSQNVRVAAKNESLGAILGSAKEKAIKNDKLLKQGVGNQGLDDVTTTFKSSKSGKEFEVAENGFGRELLSYDGQVANEEMKRAFLAWEAQEKKADITLHDGRKVVFLEPDEAVQLSYGNSYLYGEKDLEALFARRRAESLEQKLKRLQSHPAYENLLKMRENTKASELKGDTVGGSKPTVFYEPQSERYLRTQGGGGLPNAERSITITKADVAKLRADKANEALATKLENNLEALTGDPAASGLIDDLLTRDYHLASAAKKSELVAPKNADEVVGNSKIPSNKNAGMKAGFSTQALNELMLGLGSGGANAMAEDDPNKKAQAFIKGFLAGFGGAKAASMLAKNAQKLAPQLARASEKMASDFPRLLNDRPDILGGVLGRMNNAKDNFKNIFGGEKALGANRAKLEKAKDMAKNGAKDDEIWAKTGWYKDIDGKWKFEINAKGGELKKEFVDENDEIGDFFEKEIKTQKDLKAMEKYGEVDYEKFKENAKYYRKDYTLKVKDLLLNGSLKNDKLYREYMNNPLGEVKSKYKFRSGFLADILDDKPLFKAYPMLKDIRVRALNSNNGANGEYRYNRASDVLGDIYVDFNLAPHAFKSSLYHEIQHAVQHIEEFSNGGSPKQWGYEKYEKLAGEAEARNVQARLGTNGKEYPLKTMDIDPNERIVTDLYGYEIASYTPKQKEMRGVYNVAFNEKRATQIYKDIEDVENAIKFEKGRADYYKDNKLHDGFGSLHIQKHLDPKNKGYITTQEYLNMGEYIRKAGDFKESGGKRVYDYTDENGVRFRAIIGDTRGGKDRVISFFSDRNGEGLSMMPKDYNSNLAKAGSAYDRQNYTRNQPLSENSTTSSLKSQGIGGLKRGFSTQALNELMLGLGSGGANAVSEDDPNKKAEAFIKGFLAGFGGAKAASMLAKNAQKLAPQLARASEKMAS